MPYLQFFNLFFEIGFMFLFDIGIGGILYLQ